MDQKRLRTTALIKQKLIEKVKQRILEYLAVIKLKREIKGLDELVKLEELYLFQNNIEEIIPESYPSDKEGPLNNLKSLKILNLSNNKIKTIEGLNNLVNLETLNLASNKIENITGIKHLEKLTDVNLSFNNLKKIKKTLFPGNIKFLNLSISFIFIYYRKKQC
jgi:internalin A